MTTKATRARQRIERERQNLRKADAELAKERRRLDTRRKVVAGSVLLDVLLPKSENLRSLVGDALGQAIVNNTRKTVQVRREELGLFRDDLGDEWVERWKNNIGDDESA